MAEFAPTVSAASPDAPTYSALRKYTLLMIFCFSQFLDAFNVSALFSAIPIMSDQLQLSSSEAVWLVSAYQLSFAALLLSSGRISDIYNPKFVFIGGASVLGIFSIAAGFVDNKIALFVLRAFSGIAAAMTIPSSLTLLIRLFPQPTEQARAIGVYGGSAALGNVLGLIIGAFLIEYTNWSWVFWLGALIAIPIAVVAFLLVPDQPKVVVEGSKIAFLDLPGIAILTVSLVLLIFAFTSTGVEGWGSAMVIAPLVISVFGIAAFFVWEARIPADRAAFPPRTWRYPNFAILFAVAISEVYQWSAVKAAIHFLPIGLVAGPIMLFSGPLTERFEKKYVLIFSQLLIIISTVILPFADTADKYWRLAFPAFIIGAIGGSLLFVNANIAMFQSTPSEIAGTIASIFNSALQLGSAVGVAIITSIQLAIDGRNRGKEGANLYAGRAAGFWFLLAVVALETIAVAMLYRTSSQLRKPVDVEDGRTSDEATLADPEEKIKTALSSGDVTPAYPLSRATSKTDAQVSQPAAALLRTESRTGSEPTSQPIQA
ncbi:MFS general substrate transporter [Auriculariales sp. MPI-PUGE-AT-0066]|nr:MFS general substrate transporter [Auriculariales sp. MPI-PUGE-AT-0066]